MKKTIAVALMAVMLLALAACDGNAGIDKDMQDLINQEDSAPVEVTPDITTETEAAAGTANDAPSGEPSGEPSAVTDAAPDATPAKTAR